MDWSCFGCDRNCYWDCHQPEYKADFMPDRVEIIVMTKRSLRSCAGLEYLLNAFESIKELTPTHWGTHERARNPYDRNELLATVSAFKSDFYMPSLHRRQAPRYKAYFSARNQGLNYVSVEFAPPAVEVAILANFSH